MNQRVKKSLAWAGGGIGAGALAYVGWRLASQNGAVAKVLSTTGTGSTTTSTTTSPYGTNPSAPSKACPSGYAPVFQKGYGWVCTETASQTLANEKKVVTTSGASGVNMSGINQSQATTYQKLLESQYGGTYSIVANSNGSYSIVPATDYVGTTDPTSGSLYTGTQTLAQQANAIPSGGSLGSNQTETKALYQGLANMKAAGASGQQLAEYLIYYFGYIPTLAAETAASVQNTGTVFGASLPSSTTNNTSTTSAGSGSTSNTSGSSSTSTASSGSGSSGSSSPGINGSSASGVPYSQYAAIESQIATNTQTLATLESEIQANDQAIAALKTQLSAV